MTTKKKNTSSHREKSLANKKSTIIKAPSKTKNQTTPVTIPEEDIFRIIYDYSPIGIELFDKDGYLINVNKAGLGNFGISDIKELKGFSFFNDPMFPEEMKNKLRKGNIVRHEASFDFDEARKLGLFKTEKTGTIFIDMLFTPILMEKGKKINGYLAQIQDITERKNAEEALKMSEERYRTLFETANDAIFLHSITEDGLPGKFISVNCYLCEYPYKNGITISKNVLSWYRGAV